MSKSKQRKLDAITNKALLERLKGYYFPYWKLFIAGLICTSGIAAIEAWFVRLLGDTVNAADLNDNTWLARTVALIIFLHAVKWFFSYGQTYLISSATQKIAVQLRNDLYSHLQSLSLSFFEKAKIGHLMSRMTNDVGLIQGSAHQIIQIVSAPLKILFLTSLIFYMNWKLALISMIALPLISYAITRIGRGMKRLSELLQIRLADVAAVVQETLSAIRIVKSFGMEDYEINRFADENQRTYGTAMRAIRRSAAMAPTVDFISVSSIALVLWCGGSMVVANAGNNDPHAFNIGSLITFLAALQVIGTATREVARMNITYFQTMAGAQRIFDVLDEVPVIRDMPDASVLSHIKGNVEFRNVSFSYNEDEKILDDISFIAESGQQVALVGESGAGKSTIANLIPRFYDIDSGQILIDNTDIRSVTVNSLRSQIAIVPQETILFSTSIRENIAYGRMNATEEEIIEAAKAANAHEFIMRLPDGYNTMVGERGTRLSGGQRQRVAIARALLKDPRLLILDEATSSLDVASESVVQDALDKLMKNRTTIVIAHRLSTIVNADKILVMYRGRIVESGTHQELLALGGTYADLYATQSKGNLPDIDDGDIL
ncbi:MAG: ABC transporter ATP-binding protein [Armatimonadota bacterium]